jgi:hypothetical protein
MFLTMPKPTVRRHVFVCLLLLVALLGLSIAAAAHFHAKQDADQGQCALCMSCAQIVAVCTVAILAFLLMPVTEEPRTRPESRALTSWIPPSQRVRPPPTA